MNELAGLNIHELQTRYRSTGIAYLLYFFVFGAHFAYLGKWGLQILFWITLGGLFVWGLIELFLIPSRVEAHNRIIAKQIEKLEGEERKREREERRTERMELSQMIGAQRDKK